MSEIISWTVEAEAMLKEIPFFIRPFARKKIETYAQENHLNEITIEIYKKAKELFNKKYN
ncbi:Proto-chlorophyllide reductase 57 kD subunit [Synechococcus sp. PCC 7502]|uniref:PCP reductase family protein n=1 Tax=Synechococcus sp. PCC 7502 TaxID=1173263 RepID=UPI00029FD1F1|nr:PCP reductase family protein [Synechococcus sp. PCC 7502]AFY73146.1 Proto-chlorophyllide reductase 57 kD subunit [Synechococcus sp. PCC 7502]